MPQPWSLRVDRGDWKQSEYPPFWKNEVTAVVDSRRPSLSATWRERSAGGDSEKLVEALCVELSAATLALLDRLYPGALDAQRADPVAVKTESV